MAILLSVGCIGFWVPSFIAPNLDILANVLGTLLLTFLNAFFLVFLLYQRGITRKIDGISCVIYLFTISTIPILHTQWLLQLAILIFQIILWLITSCYRQEHAVEQAFLSSILLCITALFLPDILFLLPVLWLMFVVLRAMNVRVFLASIIGAIVVLFYISLCGKLGWIHLVDITDIWLRDSTPLSRESYLFHTILLVDGIFFSIANLMRQNIENTSITIFVWCIMMTFVICAILMFWSPAYFASLYIVALYCFVVLSTYFFSSRESIFSGLVFILLIITFTGIYILF